MNPKSKYALPDPYPAPRVIGKNRHYALLLQEDYAGAAGELTAISQYVYHSITLQNCFPEIAHLAHQIAISEMHHLDLLGRTISLLGLPPVFCRSQEGSPRFWTAKFVYYGEDVYCQLSANIQHERNAINTYREQLQYIEDPYTCALLERIIMDEEYHLKLFLEARDRL